MPHYSKEKIYLGTDCGATTAKTGGIFADGRLITRALRQSATLSENGTEAVINGWVQGAEGFLAENGLSWAEVAGVGLAVPGPYRSYGVLAKTPNLPASFDGWDFYNDYRRALESAAGRPIPLITGNDGHFGGVAEAAHIQRERSGSVLMLSPGSGLGCSFVHADGTLFAGDHGASAIVCHSPLPYRLLDLPLFTCGCGRDWGCVEPYTSISGLPQYLEYLLPRYPGHPLATSEESPKVKALSLRGLAQKGDSLALEIFDLQARALGYALATAAMYFDPTHVVIGGGLMDPEATTPEFRERYLSGVRAQAIPYLWGPAEELSIVPSSLGELSQSIGAALVARQQFET
ncbi:MAG: ROK family protein [Puniceicoccaceae bacterium]|nr:MAG: ROK family protein [Puniceicoccaceae bacterium]